MWRATARPKLCWALTCAALLCAAAVGLSGCGLAGRASATPSARVIKVTERDFHVSAPTQLESGRATFQVYNAGPDTHEFLIARVGGGAPLPLRPDGLTVDEERIGAATLGVLEPHVPHSTRNLTVNLTPGRYVLFCNMYGHYRGGMHSQLLVN